MKRKLISQMRNEWRSNVWMSVELIVVGVVLFGILGYFATFAYIHKPPKGIDFTDVYVGTIGWVQPTSASYKQYPDSVHNYKTDLEMLKVNLSGNPYVESVGTGTNAIPYNYNYHGVAISATDADADTTMYYYANRRYMDPELVKTLHLTGYNGESPETLAKMVEDHKLLISTYDSASDSYLTQKWVGNEAYFGNDSADVYSIGALINGIRRVDYETLYDGVLITDVPDTMIPREIAIKVKPGKGREFMESLDESYLEFGNVYVSNMMSVENRKEEAHRQFTTMMRNLTACTIFLMIAVFLGILGSFWYRTQQRIPEIAMRKVNGATDRNILSRFLAEGLMLLVLSAPVIAIIIAIVLPQLNINEYVPTPLWLIWAMLPVTLALLAIMIVAGIVFPAFKAMKTNPAEALKDQ
ncbi:MAG: ABC transporter permease [Muribaculaceae bacterium]|nr:ABC transporter permease [Muribaculaceae bacterium]MDE5595972.1 ABC transporter permease [Muribaculaceae bacterium]MDE6702409.1 ABC transporter permease [Muribaculaceae bacterium]